MSPFVRRRPSGKALVLIVLLAAMINLPMVHASWTDWRVSQVGVEVTADVTDVDELPPVADPGYFVAFRFPAEIDPDQDEWIAEVDRATYDAADAAGTIEVRVLPDRPSAYTVEGEVTHRAGLVVTLIADLALVLVVLLLLRSRGRVRPALYAVAVADVERCSPGSVLDRVDGSLYLIAGEVSGISDDALVLDLGDREVHVDLDGHANPVGYQQPAQVQARIVG